jgi:hypothetical protein
MASVYATGGSSGSNARSSQFGPLSLGLVRPIKTRVRCLQPLRWRHIARHASWMNSRLFSGFIAKFLGVMGRGKGRDRARRGSSGFGDRPCRSFARDGGFAGGSSMPPHGLQSSHGMPAPQSHASAGWLVPRYLLPFRIRTARVRSVPAIPRRSLRTPLPRSPPVWMNIRLR